MDDLEPIPRPTEELYQYAPGPDGEQWFDDVYKTEGEVVDMGQLVSQRASSPLEQDLGPIMVVTRSETPVTPGGLHETMMYALTSKRVVNLRTGNFVDFDPLDATQVQPLTLGTKWQTPGGLPTRYPVRFVARPHPNAFVLGSTIDDEHNKPGMQATTLIGKKYLEETFGENTDLG